MQLLPCRAGLSMSWLAEWTQPTAFPKLTVLKLGGNKDLSGQMPVQLLGPPKLETLDVSSCSLQGLLPTSMPVGLLNLSLGHNSLTGENLSLTCAVGAL